jgi:autoinducer 2-degrading protein
LHLTGDTIILVIHFCIIFLVIEWIFNVLKGRTAMIVTCVTVYVKHDHIDEFIAVSMENHENSVKESGNLRFDFLQSADDPCRFMLYEAYESEEAVLAHKTTGHYLKWKQTVELWMAKPREGVKHRVLAPTERSKW